MFIYSGIKKKDTISKIDDILKETEEEFKKIHLLFKENWITQITDADEPLIIQFFKSLKNATADIIKKELTYFQNYFNLKEFNDPSLIKLLNQIVILIKKEVIFQLLIVVFILFLN